ncbi:MAG: hypothetical protein AAF755_06735 [Pseudomonadota bacterium]
MRMLFVLLWVLVTAPAGAQERMTAEQFDAYTRGKTLFYSQNGATYGAEIYRENRQVEWSFLDGVCKKGFWYEEEDLICFVYEDNLDPQCWSFFRTPNGLMARFEDNPDMTELYEAEDNGEQMICLGPEVGV